MAPYKIRTPRLFTESDPHGPLLAEYHAHLCQSGLHYVGVSRRLGPAQHFLAWLDINGTSLLAIDDAVLQRFVSHDCNCAVPATKYNRLHNKTAGFFVTQVSAFVQYLEETGRTTTLDELSENISILSNFLKQCEAMGYTKSTTKNLREQCTHFLYWLHHCRISVSDITGEVVDKYDNHDCLCARPGLFRGFKMRHQRKRIPTDIRPFVRFLVAEGISTKMVPKTISLDDPLANYRLWLHRHRGIKDTTILEHSRRIMSILSYLGNDPSQYTAKRLRDAFLHRTSDLSRGYAKNFATSMRLYLRYLAATGQCREELIGSVPHVCDWRLASIPRYIRADELERVALSYKAQTHTEIRNRAIILLLCRLGLRGNDIFNLRLGDVNWDSAYVRVCGKTKRETTLPLPQDAGDALLDYILNVRPRIDEEKIFLRVRPPHSPVSHSSTITRLVNLALDRSAANVQGTRGVRVIRHSVATALLRSGATPEVVGAVLRHQTFIATAIYAKVDINSLQEVAQPWIGEEESCL